MKEMHYPEDFIIRCRDIYGPQSGVVAALRAGSVIAGRYLDDSSQGGIEPSVIVKMIESNGVPSLLATAKTLLVKKELYGEWMYNRRRQNFPDDPHQWGSKEYPVWPT